MVPSVPEASGAVGPCGPNGVFCGPYGWAPRFGVPFTDEVLCGTLGHCTLAADIYTPVERGTAKRPSSGWPLVVAIPGGPAAPGARGGLGPMATALAVRGIEVVVADWREGPDFGGPYPTAFEDVSCAVRFGRMVGGADGADTSRVTLLAHSFGGFPGAVVSLTPKMIPPLNGHCVATTGSPRPDAYVGVAPVSTLAGISDGYLSAFFGGDRTAQSAAWAASDPLALAGSVSAHRLPVRLIRGSSDPTVSDAVVAPLAAALARAGFDVESMTVAGATHTDVLTRPETLDAIAAIASE